MYEYDLPMPETYKAFLLSVVSDAIEAKTMTVNFTRTATTIPGMHCYYLSIGGCSREFKITGKPVESLNCLGLIKIFDSENFFLTPKSIEWAEYQRKNPFGKFIAKLPSTVKDLMLVIAFILSIILTCLQISDLLL